MKVTVLKPYHFSYDGVRYGPGDEVNVPMAIAMATPWVFQETQEEVSDDQRKFLDDQPKVQKNLSEKLAKLNTEDNPKAGK
jgi:hypothetical protein